VLPTPAYPAVYTSEGCEPKTLEHDAPWAYTPGPSQNHAVPYPTPLPHNHQQAPAPKYPTEAPAGGYGSAMAPYPAGPTGGPAPGYAGPGTGMPYAPTSTVVPYTGGANAFGIAFGAVAGAVLGLAALL
jgi:hypothetical protein